MKSLLQMCALTTLKYDPQLKEYYNKKKAEGKNAMLVLNNIRCKLISRVFAVINREIRCILNGRSTIVIVPIRSFFVAESLKLALVK